MLRAAIEALDGGDRNRMDETRQLDDCLMR
jgi:hypothetical protein